MSLTNLNWAQKGSLPDDTETAASGYDHSAEWGLLISGGLDADVEELGTVCTDQRWIPL